MVSVMRTFVLAMVLHPEVLEKAQDEMDTVVGTERLPEWDDRESLPYLECILKEILRLASSLRVLSLTADDDLTDGMFLFLLVCNVTVSCPRPFNALT